MSEFAMQIRCLNCLREQYAPAVWEISTQGGRCPWCGAQLEPMTYEQYRQALAAAYAALSQT